LDFLDAAERLMRLSNQCAPPGPLDAMAVLAGGEKALKQEIQKIVAEAGAIHGAGLDFTVGNGNSNIMTFACDSVYTHCGLGRPSLIIDRS